VAGAAGASGGAGQAGAGGSGGSTAALETALQADGFQLQAGKFEVMDLSGCCAEGKSCSGNNPTSPYGSFRLPPGPGQTALNPGADANGDAVTYRLRADEAILYLGATPPKARYFGFTPYLFDRYESATTRRSVFASLSETLNNGMIGVDDSSQGVFERPAVVIASADEGIDGRVRAAVTSAGWPSSALNSIVFDPSKSKLGLEEEADTFNVLFRVAIFDDADKGKAWLAALPGTVYRLTPTQPGAAKPFGSPAARAKDLIHTEDSLKSATDKLGAALITAFPGYSGQHMVVNEGTPDPDACIQGTSSCAGDNRDTIYPATIPQKMFTSSDEFYVVYGVNHHAAGKATYSNASVYAIEHLVGVASVHNGTYQGSAADYLPGDPDVGKLYAWKIARNCGSDPHCLPIPDAGCPTGLQAGAVGAIAFRVYLEPTTLTAPDPSTLVRDRVIHFMKQ
jgi:hypothetical protein